MLILGIDPGLASTGWGVIRSEGSRLAHIGNGQIRTDAKAALARRLAQLDAALGEVMAEHAPNSAACEFIFVNKNPQSTLKLAQARGVALSALARAGIDVGEYEPRLVKKAVVGTGTADKAQIHAMVKVLLPGVTIAGPDAADALAVAITHAHLARAKR